MIRSRKIFAFSIFLGVFLFLFSAGGVFADTLGFDYANDLGLANDDIDDPRLLLVNIVQFLLSFIGLVAVVMFMYGGWLWMSSAGNPDQVQKAKKTLIGATIGLIVIISSFMIVGYIANNFLGVLSGTNCTEGDTNGACGCTGTLTCVGGSWSCEGNNCNFGTGQTAFRVNRTRPSDDETDIARNFNVRAFLSKVVDPNMSQADLNSNFIIERIERDVDSSTLMGTPIAPELIPLEDIARLNGDRALGALAVAGCGDERGTPNCFPEWSRFDVWISPLTPGIVTIGGTQGLDCSNGLCRFEFVTSDLIDTGAPEAGISPTQICEDDGTLAVDANYVGGWGRDDVEVVDLEFLYFDGVATTSDGTLLPADSTRYFYDEHQYNTAGFVLGSDYSFTVRASDAAGDTRDASFTATIRVGHCCNGVQDVGEEDIDCGGPDCDSCTMRDPVIMAFGPEDGAVGNWVTINGRYFGTQTGDVFFSDGAGGWIGPAQYPSDVNAACTSDWSNRQIVVVVPPGAQDGPLRVVRDDGRADETDNDYGPPLDDFEVNSTVRPGLCEADPAFGYFEDTTLLQGTGFGNMPRTAYFGDSTLQADTSVWTDTSVVAEIPSLEEGRTSVYVEAGGEESNPLNFQVLVDESNLPIIDYISPNSAAKGALVTIYGSNFRAYETGVSKVEFDDGVDIVEADGLSFPAECQGKWWYDNYIVVAVPTDADLDLGNVEVRVTNRNNQTSQAEEFEVVAGDPGPGICLLDPHNGLIGDDIDVYGVNLDDGSGDIVRFFNNEPAAVIDSWSDLVIRDVEVPVGAETGVVRVVVDNPSVDPAFRESNTLNFQVGPCSDTLTDCLLAEECCGAQSSFAGICRPAGTCGAAGAGTTGYGWSFTTGSGDLDPLTCGGNSSRASCAAAGICPNSPGSCQTTSDLEIGKACSDTACESQFLACVGGACTYNSTTNYCEVSADTCESSLLGWADASCNRVNGQHVWQVNQAGACPLGTYLDSNGWCSIGSLGSPTVCDVCENGAVCISDTCVMPQRICPQGSNCEAGQCVLDNEICECCCEVGQSERDCCLGLECRSGGCGDPLDDDGNLIDSNGDGVYDFGECVGCRVENNGNLLDVDADEQILSDAACNCDGTQGKYCSILNPAAGDIGTCQDAKPCDADPYTTDCDVDNFACDIGQFCDDDCFCRNSKPCDGDNDVSNGCSAQGNCDALTEHCDSDTCQCRPGRSCDSDLSNAVCDDDVSLCEADEVCNSDCVCEPAPTPPGDPCDRDPLPGPANVDCDPNHCSTGYDCTTDNPLVNPCGACCCEIGVGDQCPDISPNLFCANVDTGNCEDADPINAPNYGLCCGCLEDDECGDPSVNGCGTDTCCRERPNVEHEFPEDMPEATPGDVCRNTAIEARFDRPMDLSSFTGNVLVFGDYGIDQCPEGTRYLAGQAADNSFFARLRYKTTGFLTSALQGFLPERFVSAFTIPDAATNYCAITGIVSGWRTAGDKSVLSFSPQSLLDGNRTYYVVIKGDEALDSNSGVRSINGVGLNASLPGIFQSPSGGVDNTFSGITYTNAYIWSFQTMDELELCEIDRVVVEPSSYLFQSTTNSAQEDDSDANADSFDQHNDDSDKVFVASALDARDNKIVSIPGVYQFDWTWSIVDTSIVDEVSGVANLPDDQILVRADEDIVDGHTTVNAQADSVSLAPAYAPFSIPGSAEAYVFICDNPWPAIDGLGNWHPWRDDTQGMTCIDGAVGCHNTNYEIYYCRDAGGPGTFDDLPAINSANTISRNETALACSLNSGDCSSSNLGDLCGADNQGVCTKVLKESFFFREELPDINLTTLSGVANSDGDVELTWGNVPGTDYYKVYYGTRSGNYTNERVVSLLEYSSLPYVVNELDSGRTYYFAVTSVFTGEIESALSNEIVLTPEDEAAYPPPGGLTAVPLDSAVELSWNEVVGAQSYVVYYGVVDNTGVLLADRSYGWSRNIGNDTQIIVNLEENGRTYYFAVTSVDENGNESDYSAEVSAVPDA